MSDRSREAVDRTDFPSAAAKYKALAKEERRREFPVLAHGLSRHDTPYSLSETEITVFGIDRQLAGALFWAYCRYECLVGTVEAYFTEFADAERQAFAAYEQRGENIEDAIAFMVATTGMPLAQCMGWVLKVHAADIRAGLYDAATNPSHDSF